MLFLPSVSCQWRAICWELPVRSVGMRRALPASSERAQTLVSTTVATLSATRLLWVGSWATRAAELSWAGCWWATVCAAFFNRFHLTQADLIERVYRQSQPNRFLASLVPFLSEHVEDASVRQLLVCEFRRFLVRNVTAYGRPDLAISFVGGVASHFRGPLQEAVEAEGFRLGRIEPEPVRGMALFHR